MLLPKDLIYKDKSFDYLVNEDKLCGVFEELSDCLREYGLFSSNCKQEDIEQYIAKMLNTACYICVEAHAMRRPGYRLTEYLQYCNDIYEEIKSIVNTNAYNYVKYNFDIAILSIVYFLLYSHNEHSDDINELLATIDKYLTPKVSFHKNLCKRWHNEPFLTEKDFSVIHFKSVLANPYSWEQLTKGFNPSYTTLVVNALGVSVEEKIEIVALIRKEASNKDDATRTSMYQKLEEIEAKLKAGKPLVYEKVPREYLAERARTNEPTSSTENEHLNEEQKAQLQQARAEIERLQEEVEKLKQLQTSRDEALDMNQEENESINPANYVKLEVLCKMLEHNNVQLAEIKQLDGTIKKVPRGNKANAAALFGILTGIAISQCKNHLTERKVSNDHLADVKKINGILQKLGIDWTIETS